MNGLISLWTFYNFVKTLKIFYFRGENLLFADADGATTFEDIVKLEENLAEIKRLGESFIQPSDPYHLRTQLTKNGAAPGVLRGLSIISYLYTF